MRLYLNTSASTVVLKIDGKVYEQDFGRELAEKLLGFIRDRLAENGETWQNIEEITFMSGPGSFTGLRIGAAVVNTLAHELGVPLFDHRGQRCAIILPDYGRPANISTSRELR